MTSTSTTSPTSTLSSSVSASPSASLASSLSASPSASISASASASASAISASFNATSIFPEFVTTTSNFTATSTASSADPLPTIAQAGQAEGNLVLFNQAVAYLGHIVVVGAGGK